MYGETVQRLAAETAKARLPTAVGCEMTHQLVRGGWSESQSNTDGKLTEF